MTITVTGRYTQTGKSIALSSAVGGDTAVLGPGHNGVTGLETFTISTLGGTTSFGTASHSRSSPAYTSNGTTGRGIFGGGVGFVNIIEYITISSPGNPVDFGDLINLITGSAGLSNASNDRGVFGGGRLTGNTFVISIDYVTISSEGNAADFGDFSSIARDQFDGLSNGTNERGVFPGGRDGFGADVIANINFITISTPGNAGGFGSLDTARRSTAAISNDTNERGVIIGGIKTSSVLVDELDYITISAAGNSTTFGILSADNQSPAGVSNGVNERGVSCGGMIVGNVSINTLEYITISSVGNALDFGDMTADESFFSAMSDSAA